MKIYHVKTQEDYESLMEELERMGYKWRGGSKPTEHNRWFHHGERTAICLDGALGYASLTFYEEYFPNVPIQEYKAKTSGIKMKEGVIVLGRAMNQVDSDSSVKQVANNNVETYRNIIKDLEQTYIAKNKDYGNSFEESLDEFGEIAGIVRIGDKFNRIKSLSKTEEINVKDESKIDTLLDMANYCIMQAMWMMKEEV